MALDGFTLHLLLDELRKNLIGGRVDKIQQPEKDEITIMIRQGGSNHRLVLSASGSSPRLHLTKRNKENPIQPPAFCMLLRARLTSGMLTEIRQPGLDRIAEFVFSARDELGYETNLVLRLECMGQRSNLILTDDKERITDSIKHVTEEMSRVREVLPGLTYVYPPAQDKRNPLDMEAADFLREFAQSEAGSLPKIIGEKLQGISPRTSQILASYAPSELSYHNWDESEKQRFAEKLVDFFFHAERSYSPCILMDEAGESQIDFLPLPHPSYEASRHVFYSSLSEAMDAYYLQKDGQERRQQHSSRIRQILKRNQERCLKKLEIQNQILEDLPQTEDIRIQAELLTTYGYMAQKGASAVTVPNYYQDNEPMTIALDPSKNVQVYAQQLFKRYRKAHTAAQMAQEQIRGIREEMEYLDELEASVDMARDEQSLRDIQQEMIAAKYIRLPANKKARKEKPAAPMKYTAPSGAMIRVGRNPVQNDYLTLHSAAPKDIWFHAQGIPGSHVILASVSGEEPSREDMECAAMLAAYYSKGREDTTVNVDYTQRKNVHKPSGSKPGFVLYQPFRTLIVKPDAGELLKRGIAVEKGK